MIMIIFVISIMEYTISISVDKFYIANIIVILIMIMILAISFMSLLFFLYVFGFDQM